jgi:integrase
MDHAGKHRTRKGFTDKGKTEQLAAKIENEEDLRRRGLIDPELDKAAERRNVPIADLLKAFETSLANNSPRYIKLHMGRVRRVVDGCGFEVMSDVREESIAFFLNTLAGEDGIGNRTYNHYVQSFHSFCHWAVRTKRIASNPVIGMERLNTEVDVRHRRRALTADEVAKLVASARSSGELIQCFDGEARARLYILSYMTGLRRNEIASLTPRSFSLDATPPTVTVEAAFSKHRRRDVLPLHPELVTMLREWLVGMDPDAVLFSKLGRRRTWLMVKKDLERVGIEYETPEGIADFHAAGRHTHITELLRNGASLPEAKELARHADVKMTMRYTHIGINDQAKALRQLPWNGRVEESRPPGDTSSEEDSSWEHNGSKRDGSRRRIASSSDAGGGSENETTQATSRNSDATCRKRSSGVSEATRERNTFDSRRLHSTPPESGGVFS